MGKVLRHSQSLLVVKECHVRNFIYSVSHNNQKRELQPGVRASALLQPWLPSQTCSGEGLRGASVPSFLPARLCCLWFLSGWGQSREREEKEGNRTLSLGWTQPLLKLGSIWLRCCCFYLIYGYKIILGVQRMSALPLFCHSFGLTWYFQSTVSL